MHPYHRPSNGTLSPIYITGNWAQHDQDEEEQDENEEDDWGANTHDNAWEGATDTAAHTSPAAGPNPPLAGGWGQDDEPAWNVTTGGLTSVISKAFGLGGHPDPNSAPELKKKSTLKKDPAAAPPPPASRHVAFGATHLHPSAAAAGGAPPPPPPPPQPTGVIKAPTTTSPHQMNHPMRGRSHSQPGFVNGWGLPPGGTGGVPNPGVPAAQANHPAMQAYLRARAHSATDPRAAPTAPTQAWQQWGKEKNSATPQVAAATTIAANVPTVTQVYAQHSQTQPAADAALARAMLLQQHAQLQEQLRLAKLQEALTHPGQHRAPAHGGQIPPGLQHQQMPLPTDPTRSPVWQNQAKKSWQAWSQEHQQQGGQRGYGQGPSQHPQAVQMSTSWGSTDWTDVGREGGGGGGAGAGGGWNEDAGRGAGAGAGAGGGWNEDAGHGGAEEWPKGNDGDWGTTTETGAGYGANAGGWNTYNDEAQSRKKHGGKSDRKHGRGHKENEADGGWGQSKGNGGWDVPSQDPSRGDVWGQYKGNPGGGKSPKVGGGWDPIEEEEEEEEDYEDEDDEDEDEEDEDPWPDTKKDRHHSRYSEHDNHQKHGAQKRLSYEYRSPGSRSSALRSPRAPYPQFGTYPPQGQSGGRTPLAQHPLLSNPEASRTMGFAAGRVNTLFDLTPPLDFHWGGGACLTPAERALFGSDKRLAKHRIHWGFNPDKDQRVATLMAWIEKMSGELVFRGVSSSRAVLISVRSHTYIILIAPEIYGDPPTRCSLRERGFQGVFVWSQSARI